MRMCPRREAVIINVCSFHSSDIDINAQLASISKRHMLFISRSLLLPKYTHMIEIIDL